VKPFFVYMLRCADGSFYVGHTDELERRVAQHQAGEIPGYTHERRPVKLVWMQEMATREEALGGELRVKGWSRAKKQALIAGDWDRVSELARSRQSAPSSVRPELVEGLVRGEAGLRQAQPDPSTGPGRTGERAVRPEPVEGLARGETGLRQAQPERVSAQPVEGPAGMDESLLEGILAHQRRAIAKSITLLESTRPDHRLRADALLNALLPHTGRALRLGISGVPGVGKSTFIEAFGLHLIAQGHRVAVLTVDPSSTVSGGSILGDKTRMEQLSVNDAAYIRPSPSSGTLGGVAEKTREAMLVCEAAGHDVVLVETVGVGQSETAVASMTDMFVLLQLPNAGDDLQAIKKGVMELADLVVINKADLDPVAATRAEAQITSALRVFSFHGRPDQVPPARVMQISALKSQGITEFWQRVQQFADERHASGEFERRRERQAQAWMWDLIHARLHADFKHHPRVHAALAGITQDVAAARVAPSSAAHTLLRLFFSSPSSIPE
jgi:LAO/AO transport system kinase